MDYFKNKVIWITGATSGIGYALAQHVSKIEGVKLVISARNAQKLEEIAPQFSNNGADVLVLPLDLANYEYAQRWVDKVAQTFKRVDILINNGGVSQRSWAIETPIEIDKKIFDVNFFGTIALTKALLPLIIGNGGGHLVTVSSIAGKFGFYLRSSYSASKHALHGFFDSLRLELEKDNIKVTLVCPGKINTNISLNALTGKGELHNQQDDSIAKGMSAELCAKKILKAVASNKKEVYIGGSEIIPVYIKRFFPALLDTILRRQKIE